MSQTILVVDDEPEIVKLVRAYLQEAGYRVVTARNGREALLTTRREKPDLIILDLTMPEMDGLEFTRRLRQEKNTPIIMLTARVHETDHILGLEMGGDDYVTKPFSPRTLVARVRALLRRAQPEPVAAEILRTGDLVLDRNEHSLTVNDRPVNLTPTEFELLATLMAHPGRVFSRAELLERLQGEAFAAYERTIDAHVKNVRAKVEPDPSKPRYILTVFGVGYKFARD
ncbi:MAG: response regulator transcription factor [Anaerolineae bacterium]|jgi:DNA-binding response OmpR family regulator